MELVRPVVCGAGIAGGMVVSDAGAGAGAGATARIATEAGEGRVRHTGRLDGRRRQIAGVGMNESWRMTVIMTWRMQAGSL